MSSSKKTCLFNDSPLINLLGYAIDKAISQRVSNHSQQIHSNRTGSLISPTRSHINGKFDILKKKKDSLNQSNQHETSIIVNASSHQLLLNSSNN